jgi:DNA-binding GntR family transcriptional regulator
MQRYDVFMSVAQDSLLYSRVETVLASEITDGVLRVGDQLPTEDDLIARFDVSPNLSLNKAMRCVKVTQRIVSVCRVTRE